MPFEIPSSWVWTTGNEIFSPLRSCIPQGDTFIYVDIDAIDNKVNIIKNPKIMRTADAPSRATRYTKAGDVLFSMVRPYLRNIAIVPENSWIASTGFYVCSPSKLLLSQYCYYLMLSDYVVDGLNQYMKGDNSPSINNSHILSWLYPIPPLTEQQRIVKEIERWFASIDEIEQDKSDLQTIIKQAKSKILDLAIHGKLVPQDPNDEPAIELLKRINPNFTPCDNGRSKKLPQGWIYCRLCDVLKITMGQSPIGDSISKDRGIEFHQGKLYFSDKYLQPSNAFTTKPTKIAEANSLLLCVRAPVGIVNITQSEICIGRGLCALKPLDGNVNFYFYLLQTIQESFENQSTGTTFKAISGDVVRNETISLPPLAEQQRIVAKIEELFSTLDNIQKALEA